MVAPGGVFKVTYDPYLDKDTMKVIPVYNLESQEKGGKRKRIDVV